MVWECDEKRGALCYRRRKEGDGNESTGKRGGPKRFRRWLDKVKDDIKEKGLAADEVYDRATSWAGECHRTSTPHKSGNNMK